MTTSARRSAFGTLYGSKCYHGAIISKVSLLCYLALCLLPDLAESAPGICSMNGCNCTVKAHRWINVKCVFTNDQRVQRFALNSNYKFVVPRESQHLRMLLRRAESSNHEQYHLGGARPSEPNGDFSVVELLEGTIPSEAMEVEVSHCRELKIQSGAFAGGAPLKRVHVSGIYSVIAKRQAFENLRAPNTHLEVSECNSVIIESHAFRNSRGTLSVSISRCKHVAIKPNAFSWLLWITVKEVPTLELSSNAFKFESSQYGRHGQATKIMFQSVRITELPTAVFPSSVAEVRMDDIWTKVIRREAFCAMSIFNVIISNASISEIETGAFSDKILIESLEFVDVRLKYIESGAFRAGHDNVTIRYCRLSDVRSGAIEISAATVTFGNNEFQSLRNRSIVLHQWNHIAIENNLFVDLEEDAIVAEMDAKPTKSAPTKFEFSFTGNHIQQAQPGSLKFTAISQLVNTARVGNNYFKEKCNCNLENWVRKLTGRNSSVSWMMDSSYCVVDRFFEKCFNLPEGYLGMRNFTKLICTESDHHVNCEKPSVKPEPSVSPPSVGPHVYPRHKGYFDVEMSDPEQLEREKRIIVVICVVAVFTVLVVILASGILYMRRRGVCPKLTSGPLMNLASWLSPNSGMTAATSARSISRLSVHEYAGLQPETRILEVETRPDITEEDADADETVGLYRYTEDKATQTLPEELTEEYLRDLRERLNDPDNYSQARDMIEHLYDLIKVEESCNNNNDRQTTGGSGNGGGGGGTGSGEENAYDVIRPKAKKHRGPARPSVSVGTRVPSLEKLLPAGLRTRPPITEYTEPRDQRTSDQNHLYAELPGDETVPSTSRLSQPVLATLAGRAPQPLPPDVVNGCSPSREPREVEPLPESPKLESVKNQGRPMSFLKALGESILGATKINGNNKRPNSLLCEYAEPSDATAHLYSELPEPQTSTPATKMANRPLPTKPDQDSNLTAKA